MMYIVLIMLHLANPSVCVHRDASVMLQYCAVGLWDADNIVTPATHGKAVCSTNFGPFHTDFNANPEE